MTDHKILKRLMDNVESNYSNMIKEAKKDKTCKNCSGKGYNTEMIGDRFAMADFVGDKTYRVSKAHIVVRVCKYCQRGKDIKKHFNIKKAYDAKRY